jgi:uncharacterized protein YlxW (UPF0749 family)
MDATYIALGAVILAAITLASQMLGKSLSIREHEEFSKNTKERLSDLKSDYQRESNRLEDRIKTLEQTRPTTGEIEARLDKKT